MVKILSKSLFVLFFLIFNSSQLLAQSSFTETQIEAFVEEVFSNKSQEVVFNNPERFKVIKSFFSRLKIELRADININKRFDDVLELPINKKYNKTLQRDATYTSSFNPLKYGLPMFPNKRQLYRIGNTKYILSINPLN